MKPIAIGGVLAAVFVAASFLVPKFMQPATGRTTLEGLEAAELARRQLHAYDVSLPLVAARTDLDQIQDARFEKVLRENQALLERAAGASRSATQTSRDALGVGQVAGAVDLARAARLLAEARRVRAQLVTEQTRAFALAIQWAETRDAVRHYSGLDVTAIRSNLTDDLEEIRTARAQAQAQVDQLTRTVAEHEQTLAGVRAELERLRAERLSLEEMGFRVGDDASFKAYRQKYVELSDRLRQLQDQEQLLAFGGRPGEDTTEEDLLADVTESAEAETPEIEAGEAVLGLEELRRRLVVAQEQLAGYASAQEALQQQDKLIAAVGDSAQAHQADFAARREKLAGETDQILKDMAELAQAAFDKETEALRAARDAASAFRTAKSAVDNWISAARALKQQKDPKGANERLKRIINDTFAADSATSGEAQAKTLAGRILTERALALGAYWDALRRIKDLRPESAADTEALQESFNTACEEAVSTLSEARDLYERMAQKQANTSWIHQASLATVYHLLWQVDELNASQHRSNAIAELTKAVERRQQSPYLRQQVALHRVLTGGVEVPSAPVEAPAPEEGPAEETAEDTEEEGG